MISLALSLSGVDNPKGGKTLLPVATMAKKKDADPVYCTYRSVKVDDQLVKLLQIAAIEDGTSAAEVASDYINRGLAERSGRNPIKRRPAPPRGRRPAP